MARSRVKFTFTFTCSCYNCLPENKVAGSKHLHVEDVVKNKIKFNRGAFCWSRPYDYITILGTNERIGELWSRGKSLGPQELDHESSVIQSLAQSLYRTDMSGIQ